MNVTQTSENFEELVWVFIGYNYVALKPICLTNILVLRCTSIKAYEFFVSSFRNCNNVCSNDFYPFLGNSDSQTSFSEGFS